MSAQTSANLNHHWEADTNGPRDDKDNTTAFRKKEDGGDEERASYRTCANEFDFRYMRATDLPFNQRITLPKSVNESIELKMQNLKGDLKKVTKEVKSEVTSNSNLTSEQQRDVKSLIRRVKEKEIVVFQTDKSGRFSVDTTMNRRGLTLG